MITLLLNYLWDIFGTEIAFFFKGVVRSFWKETLAEEKDLIWDFFSKTT